MRRPLCLLLGRAVAALLAAAAWAALQASPAFAQEMHKDEASGLEYLEVVTGGAAPDDALPLVIAMHGLGDHPAAFRLLLDDLPARARVLFPRAPMPHGDDGYSWFEFHADDAVDGTRLAAGVRAAADRVALLLADVAREHPGPPRAIACGFSQGGMLAFALAALHPEQVSVAVSLSGYLPTGLWPAQRPAVRPLPRVVALHGEADRLIPMDAARWSVEALRANGYDATLQTWPGVGHNLSPAIRASLETAVVRAVSELSQPGGVLPGPPTPPGAAMPAPALPTAGGAVPAPAGPSVSR